MHPDGPSPSLKRRREGLNQEVQGNAEVGDVPRGLKRARMRNLRAGPRKGERMPGLPGPSLTLEPPRRPRKSTPPMLKAGQRRQTTRINRVVPDVAAPGVALVVEVEAPRIETVIAIALIMRKKRPLPNPLKVTNDA
jgi:hypothetical protein